MLLQMCAINLEDSFTLGKGAGGAIRKWRGVFQGIEIEEILGTLLMRR